MRDLLRKMKPDHINDLVALVALYRPGPMDSIPKYIACKNGKEKRRNISIPLLEPILQGNLWRDDLSGRCHAHRPRTGRLHHGRGRSSAPRHGQEDPGGNDPAAREVHQGRGRARHHPGTSPRQIFEQAEKFAGYGFNKGHAAAYAQVAYQTAYLKANYPVEFLAASMTLDIGNTDRLNIFRQEAQRLGVKVAPPDINRSRGGVRLRCRGRHRVLCAGRGQGRGPPGDGPCGRGAPRRAARSNRSSDFARRVDPRLVNKRAFENLARAGAFDSLNHNRRQLVENSDRILGGAQAAPARARKRPGVAVRRRRGRPRNCA